MIIFTAANKDYADTIIDYLDPDGDLIEARLYRDSCLRTKDKLYIKDLRIFEDQWLLNDIVLIDNTSHSFALQPWNGLPILPYFNGKQDIELLHVAAFLWHFAESEDLRKVLRQTFLLPELLSPEVSSAIGGVEYATEYLDTTQQFEQE